MASLSHKFLFGMHVLIQDAKIADNSHKADPLIVLLLKFRSKPDLDSSFQWVHPGFSEQLAELFLSPDFTSHHVYHIHSSYHTI